MPPLETGIAQYSRDLLDAIGSSWPLSVVPEPGEAETRSVNVHRFGRKQGDQHMDQIAHVGNSGFHPVAFERALHVQGITVLHDLVLHHARLGSWIRKGKGRDYERAMTQRYGEEGRRAAQKVLRGAAVDLNEYPLSEDYLEAARVAIVHSQFSKDRALIYAPEATVQVVPMGVPLPALIDREAARDHLGLPQSAFIVTSITHVNPYKRLHIVLRALREVVRRYPETLLVIAGSVAPGMDLERRVAHLGLQRHVRILGYVSDDDSRILARAGDVAVNLRYPSTGETSASLLRLLGAAVPVLVTPYGPTTEFPEDVAIRVPVDRFEEETVAEYLLWLAQDATARRDIGNAARRYIEQNHSMAVAVEGYRSAVRDAFGRNLPLLAEGMVNEPAPALRVPAQRDRKVFVPTSTEAQVADALADLKLASHDGTIQSVARAMISIGLKGDEMTLQNDDSTERSVSQELIDVLACPACKAGVRLETDRIVCESCGRRYRIENGIPVMIVDEAELPSE